MTATLDVLEDLAIQQEDASGRDYWRSLDELASTPEFQAYLDEQAANGAFDEFED